MVTIPCRLVGWGVVWIACLAVPVSFLSPVYFVLFIPLMLYATYRAVLQIGYFPWSINIKRVLQQYPWQLLHDVPRGRTKHPRADEDELWYEIPNPDKPEEGVPLLFLANMRVLWWVRRFGTNKTKPELKGQIEPLWFAGDPRFYAVVAAPGRGGNAPRRLHFLYQRSARWDTRVPTVDWNADPVALDRARRAGARVPEPAHPQSPPR